MYTPPNTNSPAQPNSAFAPNIPSFPGPAVASPLPAHMPAYSTQLKKPLLIEPLSSTDPFEAAAWFHDVLSVAVNKAYPTPQGKDRNMNSIITYLTGPARDKFQAYCYDQDANDPGVNPITNIVADYDVSGNPTQYNGYQKFYRWFYSSQGFGFSTTDLARDALKHATHLSTHDYSLYSGNMTKYLPLFFEALSTENGYLGEISSNFIRGLADPMLKQMAISRFNDLKEESETEIEGGATRLEAEMTCLRQLIQFPATYSRHQKQYMHADPQEAANIKASAAAAFGHASPVSTQLHNLNQSQPAQMMPVQMNPTAAVQPQQSGHSELLAAINGVGQKFDTKIDTLSKDLTASISTMDSKLDTVKTDLQSQIDETNKQLQVVKSAAGQKGGGKGGKAPKNCFLCNTPHKPSECMHPNSIASQLTTQ